MAATQHAETLVLGSTRDELMAQHAEARKRRNAAEGGSHAWEQAVIDICAIETEIARLERAMTPPRV